MAEDDLLISKIDIVEPIDDSILLERNEIKQRNDYYEELIAKNNPPLILNSNSLKKITSKDVFEKAVLKSGKHLSTLIPEYKITRDFIFNLLKNYFYFDLTEEESKVLLQKYFSDTVIEEKEEEVIDLCDEGVGGSETDLESVLSFDEEEIIPIIEDKPIPSSPRVMPSVTNLSSIRSMPTEHFTNRKEQVLKMNNMNIEKINETKEIKKNISLFLKNAIEKRSGIDKRATIIQFLYKNNFKGKFDSSFFDIKDEKGDLIFDQGLIDEWYNAIEQIEEKQKATFECSQLIITASLYGIECLARRFGIVELSSISSEIRDPLNLPKHLESTKRSLSNIIDDNVPNFFLTDLLFFIGNVYIKNKVGLNRL